MEPVGSMAHSQGLSSSEALCDVSEHPCFHSMRLLDSRQTPQLEDHSWSAIHDCLFSIFAANLLHIWRPTPLSATQGTGHAVVTGTHGWIIIVIIIMIIILIIIIIIGNYWSEREGNYQDGLDQ